MVFLVSISAMGMAHDIGPSFCSPIFVVRSMRSVKMLQQTRQKGLKKWSLLVCANDGARLPSGSVGMHVMFILQLRHITVSRESVRTTQ